MKYVKSFNGRRSKTMADEMNGVPEALRLAALLDADEWPGSMSLVGYARACVAELLRLHAELEAQLESIGAGGVNGPLIGSAFTAADMPDGITRDDTAHGETYYTAADMATARSQGFRDGVASHGQAPAQPVNTKTHDLLSTMIGLFLRAKEKTGYQPGSAIDKTVAEAVEYLKDWPYPEPTPLPQAAQQAPTTYGGCPECGFKSCVARQCTRPGPSVLTNITAQQAPAGATEMENLQRTAVGWQERALRAERNWAACRRWAIAGGAPVEKLGDDPDQPFHAASPAIEGESNV